MTAANPTELNELSSQIRKLLALTASQKSEIIQLRRQLQLLSELKGVSLGKKQFWERNEDLDRVHTEDCYDDIEDRNFTDVGDFNESALDTPVTTCSSSDDDSKHGSHGLRVRFENNHELVEDKNAESTKYWLEQSSETEEQNDLGLPICSQLPMNESNQNCCQTVQFQLTPGEECYEIKKNEENRPTINIVTMQTHTFAEEVYSSGKSFKQSHDDDSKAAPSMSVSESLRPNFQESYSLSNHAVTLNINKDASDLGMFTRPVLSPHELETLSIIKLPEWIVSSRDNTVETSNESFSSPTPTSPSSLVPSNSIPDHDANTHLLDSSDILSHERKEYIKEILSCTQEYIEPPRSKTLQQMFAGWNPGPGERRVYDERINRGSQEETHRPKVHSPSILPVDGNYGRNNEQDKDEHDIDDIDFDRVSNAAAPKHRSREPLPVRTVTIRIRPDVLCDAVMDTVSTTIITLEGRITMRKEGQLRAVIPERKMRVWLQEERESIIDEEDIFCHSIVQTHDDSHNDCETLTTFKRSGSTSSSEISIDPGFKASGYPSLLCSSTSMYRSRSPKYVTVPPYLIDVQLVTKKVGQSCHRLLLLRVYRIQDVACFGVYDTQKENNVNDSDSINTVSITQDENVNKILQYNSNSFDVRGIGMDILSESEQSLKSLREAAALIQRINAVGGEGFSIQQHCSKNASKNASLSERMNEKLLKKARSPPSVGVDSISAFNRAKRKSHGVFPSLSKEDSPCVKASWTFLRQCIQDLDEHCMSYSTLGIIPIFATSSFQSIDSHFISQIKSICYDEMTASLLETSFQLESYAHESEVSCCNLDQLLYPTFELYELAPIPVPKPIPLTAYPLEFKAPEEILPPWGPEVAKSLNELTLKPTDSSEVESKKFRDTSSFKRADCAVISIVSAFNRQNDVEKVARLARKNVQVLDRLGKMKSHERQLISTIKDSYASNFLAANAADKFHSLRMKSLNVDLQSDMMHPKQVPLLICDVVAENQTGKCYVTSSQILFVTRLRPIIGGDRIHSFHLQDVEGFVNPPVKSMISHLPSSITLLTSISGMPPQKVYSFIPSIGANKFANFLKVVQEYAVEDSNV